MLFMHHEQKVNFIIVSNELQKITAFTMPWPLINILSQLQMFKKKICGIWTHFLKDKIQ